MGIIIIIIFFFWQSLLRHILSAANHPTTGCETIEAVKWKIATQEFVDGLLNNTVSSSDYTVLNVKMMHEYWVGKDARGRKLWPNLRHHIGSAWKRWRKLWKNISQNHQCSSWDSTWIPPKYKPVLIPTAAAVVFHVSHNVTVLKMY